MKCMLGVILFAVVYIAVRVAALLLWGIDPTFVETAVVIVAYGGGVLAYQVTTL